MSQERAAGGAGKVLLANPRGFCAGVERAIEIVERALARFGAPVYVRHEIVHNRHVVEDLRGRGAVFVEEISEIPAGAVTVFSAHGVARVVEAEAGQRGLHVIDATCPLVARVHAEAERYAAQGLEVVLVGHAGHPEVVGTLGRVPGTVHLIGSVEDAEALMPRDPDRLAYVTQTTLSVDDTRLIIAALTRRFPSIRGPDVRDICYATQNRQTAVRALARRADLVLVIGSQNSSNSNRLREIASGLGVPSHLVENAAAIDPAWLSGRRVIGLTAGASAPELLVRQAVDRLGTLGFPEVEDLEGVAEDVVFKLPPELRDTMAV